MFCHKPPLLLRPWGQKVKIQLFQNMIMLHIELKESRMQQHGKNILPTKFPQRPWGGAKRSQFTIHVGPPVPGVGSKGQNSGFSEHGHGAYQIKGNGA